MRKSRSTPSIPITGHAIELPELEDEVSLRSLRTRTGLLARVWGWIQARQVARSSTRRLRVAETVSLGEKRFVAVVQVDGRHFLLAGGPTNIALLAQLDAKQDFEDVLKKTMTVTGKQRSKRKQSANIVDTLRKKTRTTPGKQAAKPVSKRNALPGVPANTPLMAHLNGTEAFGDVLKKTMTAPGMQPSKQNGKYTTAKTGEYA